MKEKALLSQRALIAAATFALATLSAASAEVTAKATVTTLAAVSPAVRVANDLGPVDGTKTVNITLHLKPQNKAEFDKKVADLYDPTSPNFHKWMGDAELKQYAPTDAAVATVRKELESKGLQVLSVDRNNFSVRVAGAVSSVETAFGTPLHQFEKDGKTFRANIAPAQLSAESAAYVSSISGLESHTVQPMFKRAVNAKTNQPYAPVPLSKTKAAGGLSGEQTAIALTTPSLIYRTTPGESLPVGYYYGNVYDANPLLAVGFTGSQLQAVYGLPAAYAAGIDGTGQTIVLLEAYGDSHILADANAFSALNGLPPISASNYSIVYPEGPPADGDQAATLTGWDLEIALDVEWSHAIAPGAKIVVVASDGQDSEDFQYAMQYIVNTGLGYAVSDSWEEDTDLLAGPAEQDSFEDVLEIAAARGVSFQFSSGDSGDSGLGTPVGAAGVPSVAPHATAVGGTALLNNINGNNAFLPVGWGDTFAILDSDGVLDPPESLGILGGAGGGESVYFPKPSWQAGLPGIGRQTPDVSALADPYTGVDVVITEDGVQEVDLGVGGTSLASPIFTAFWALAQQKAGGPLGQAAPLIATHPSLVEDVLPLASWTSTIGLIVDSTGSTFYNSAALFPDTNADATTFTSAIWELGSSAFPFDYDLAFGLDSSLTVTQGWDNVTGFGTPYGLPFINGVAAAVAKK